MRRIGAQVLVLWLVFEPLLCFEADSCVADGTCDETGSDGAPQSEKWKVLRDEVLPPHTSRGKSARSLIEQEVFELEALSELYHQQLALLEDLQRGLHAGLGRHLPKSNVQAMLEGVPPLSEQVICGAPPSRFALEEEDESQDLYAGKTATAAALDDFVVQKAVVPQESPATLLGLMPLRNHRSTAPTPTSQIAMPTVLVVTVQDDGDICLHTVAGDRVHVFASGHKQAISQLAVSPMQDEYVVATADIKGVIRVHRLLVRPRRNPQEQRRRVTNPEEEKVSTHLGSPANITAQFHLATRVPMDNSTGHLPQLTAFVMTATQGVKYFLVGDSVGWISVFTRNGTLHERLRVSNQTVSSINAHLGNVVYVAGHQWGLIDLEKGTARAFHCYKYHGAGVLDAVSDTALQTRVIAADLDGSIWVFSVRDKRDCKVEHRFPLGATRAPLSLASVRGFVLVMEPLRSFTGKAEVTVLNMTHVGKSWDDPARDVSPISWKRSSRPLRDWAVQRRYQEGDLLVTLSKDGMEIEIYELMMQVYQPPPADILGNFKLPVFAAAMVLVMGYQFVKQKGPYEPGGDEGGEGDS